MYRIEILDATGGFYLVGFENLYAYPDKNHELESVGFNFRLDAGAELSSEGWISGVPQYSKGTASTGTLTIRHGNTTGPIVASCDISISDDDNSAYIGQRNHHPYGGTWHTTPHCYTPGCGWQ